MMTFEEFVLNYSRSDPDCTGIDCFQDLYVFYQDYLLDLEESDCVENA